MAARWPKGAQATEPGIGVGLRSWPFLFNHLNVVAQLQNEMWQNLLPRKHKHAGNKLVTASPPVAAVGVQDPGP